MGDLNLKYYQESKKVLRDFYYKVSAAMGVIIVIIVTNKDLAFPLLLTVGIPILFLNCLIYNDIYGEYIEYRDKYFKTSEYIGEKKIKRIKNLDGLMRDCIYVLYILMFFILIILTLKQN